MLTFFPLCTTNVTKLITADAGHVITALTPLDDFRTISTFLKLKVFHHVFNFVSMIDLVSFLQFPILTTHSFVKFYFALDTVNF